MRVLVTGGAGFVGSHVVDALVAQGDEVRVLDVLHPAAHRARPDGLNASAEYVWDDVCDVDVVRRCLDGIDAVCHQASMVGLGVAMSDVVEYVRHNDAGTASLAFAMDAGGFDGHVVLAGSMVVYGEGRYRCAAHGVVRPAPRPEERLRSGAFEPCCPVCDDDLAPEHVPEDAPADPRNVYAATKLHQEHLLAAFARASGASLTVLRYHNVYGPRMPRDTPYAGVASIFRSALEAGRAPRVFEDGRQIRDFVHVRDVARANLAALRSRLGGTFNVASGTPHTVGEMAAALADAFGGPAPEVTGEYRLGDVRHVFASTRLAAERLGFEAQTGFEDGMREFATARLRA